MFVYFGTSLRLPTVVGAHLQQQLTGGIHNNDMLDTRDEEDEDDDDHGEVNLLLKLALNVGSWLSKASHHAQSPPR